MPISFAAVTVPTMDDFNALAARVTTLEARPTPVPTPTPAPVPSPAPAPVLSPDGTTVPTMSSSITSADGVWTLTASQQIALNGKTDPVTAQVLLLVYTGGVLYQENSQLLWWSWTNGTWVSTSDPRSSGAVVPHVTIASGDTYKLVYDSEFNSPLDIGDVGHPWSARFPWDGINTPSPTTPGDGSCHCPLSPSVETSLHSSYGDGSGGTYFRGGIFEARMKLIPGWNAFWGYGAYHIAGGVHGTDPRTHTGEIDWMETDSNQPTTLVCTIHTDSDGSNNPPDQQTGGNPDGTRGNNNHTVPNIYDGNFHTFGGIWKQDHIEWWMDGKLVGSCPAYPESWQYMNIVCGSGRGGVNGGTQTASGDVLIDYIRVWQRPGIDSMLPKGTYTPAQILAS